MPVALMNGAGTKLGALPQPPPSQPGRAAPPTKIPKAAFFSRKRGSASPSPSPTSSSFPLVSPSSSTRSPLKAAATFSRGETKPLAVSVPKQRDLGDAGPPAWSGDFGHTHSESTNSLAYPDSSDTHSTAVLAYAHSSAPPTAGLYSAEGSTSMSPMEGALRGGEHTEVLADENEYVNYSPTGVPDTFGRSSRTRVGVSDGDDETDEFGGGYSSASDADRFTAVPRPSRKGRQRTPHRSPGNDVRIARSALESPPPHVRRQEPERDAESHESVSGTSGSGTSAQTGISASSLGLGGASLSASTSTAVTHVTAHNPPSVARASVAMGSDEMMLALLAGQAAVDCNQLPIGAWEDVENWKKELSILSTRLEALQQRHQREVKILGAARTLSRLNSSHKRMSHKTEESLAQSERRVEAAEKEVLVLRDREAALRRRLMEHWAGVMAWEVRRLETRASESSARHAVRSGAFEEAQDREYELTQRIRNLEEQLASGGGVGQRAGWNREEFEELQMREQDLTYRLRAAESELEHYGNLEREFQSERIQHGDKLRRAEAERDQYSERLRALKAERNQHGERSRGLEMDLDDRAQQIRRLEAERESQAEQLRQLEAERDNHAQQARQLQTERDTHADRIRVFETQRGTENEQLGALQSQRALHLQQLRTVEAERDDHSQRSRDLQTEGDRQAQRIAELEEMLAEAGRREKVLESNSRALEENARGFDDAAARWAEDRDEWLRERDQMYQDRIKERDQLNAQMDELEAERDSLLNQRDALNKERDDLHHQHATLVGEASTHSRALERYKAETQESTSQRDLQLGEYEAERTRLVDEHTTERNRLVDEHAAERKLLVAEHDAALSRSRSALERISTDLGALLGRGPIAESDMAAAVDELRALLAKRSREIARLQDEVNETSEKFGELVTLQIDRDAWKKKAEDAQREANTSTSGHRAAQGETMELIRKIRSQENEIAALKTRLEVAQMTGEGGAPAPELENKVATLEAELAALGTSLSKVWSMLPAPGACGEAGLSDPRVISPNSVVNFAALQKAYAGAPADDKYPGVDGLLARVQSVVSDGRLMVERMARMDKEKERHKNNAAKAAKLVEDSRHSLETYQRQVSDLQERLARSSATVDEVDLRAEIDRLRAQLDSVEADNRHLATDLREQVRSRSATEMSKLQSEVDSMHRSLVDAHAQHRRLTDDIAAKEAAVTRLNEVNDALSARTLSMANEAAGEKAALQTRLQGEIDNLRAQLTKATESVDDERLRYQDQHMALLNEMNSLQEEVAVLRNKLRAAGGGK